MTLSKQDRAEYALFMHVLADKADAIARHYFGKPIAQEVKADNSPVTLADKEIEMALVQQIRTHYPEHGILGEETARINQDAPLQWVIDPIDGTKAFIAGKQTFVTLIALCENDTPILGLISQAIQKKRWLGGDSSTVIASEHKERGNPNKIASTADRRLAMTNLREARIATTSISYFNAEEIILFQHLEKITSSTLLNADGFAAGLMANGEVDILIESGLKPYDFCALVPVIEQAGGIITDWQGEPITIESDGKILAAANKSLHKAVLDLLNSHSAT